jgi:hypothetical protein
MPRPGRSGQRHARCKHLDKKAGTATFTLTYSNVGTTAPLTGTVTQAHIHFGKRRDSGGVMVFFCTNLGNGPVGTPACPANSGTVSGTLTAASVVAIAGQNVKAGDFDALVDALESNTAYANIHTTILPAGEIRGQVHRDRRDRDHDPRRQGSRQVRSVARAAGRGSRAPAGLLTRPVRRDEDLPLRSPLSVGYRFLDVLDGQTISTGADRLPWRPVAEIGIDRPDLLESAC